MVTAEIVTELVVQQGELGTFLSDLEGTGLFAIVLPFLLVFALAYGLLEEIDVLGNSQANAIVALVIGLFFIQDQRMVGIGDWMMDTMGTYGLFLVIGILLVIPLALGGKSPGDFGGDYANLGLLALLGAAVIVWQQGGFQQVFGVAAPTIPGVDMSIWTAGVILFVAGAMYYIVSDR